MSCCAGGMVLIAGPNGPRDVTIPQTMEAWTMRGEPAEAVKPAKEIATHVATAIAVAVWALIG